MIILLATLSVAQKFIMHAKSEHWKITKFSRCSRPKVIINITVITLTVHVCLDTNNSIH